LRKRPGDIAWYYAEGFFRFVACAEQHADLVASALMEGLRVTVTFSSQWRAEAVLPVKAADASARPSRHPAFTRPCRPAICWSGTARRAGPPC
jgi:hypothetical protein